jgi:hypothetical protein
MSARPTNHLVLALALALVGACAGDNPVEKATGAADKPDDDTGDVTGDDDDVVPADDDDDDDDAPPPPKDAGVKDSGSIDSGPKAGAPDAKTPDTGSGSADTGVTSTPDGGHSSGTGTGMCCDDGDCLCHGPAPTALTADPGPYKTMSYVVQGVGCIFYPTDAEAPLAAVSISDGFTGTGGCNSFQTGQWGPLYASWGIVAMIIDTGSSDQPNVRGMKLTKAIETFKSENGKSGSPLMGKLSGRYSTQGFSMGGGGTTYSSAADKTLRSSVAQMPWGPVNMGIAVPTLVICGSSDSTAPCAQHGTPAYMGIPDSVPKMRIQINSGHAGQPTSGGSEAGRVGLAFQKVFLEGDTRWRSLLVAAKSEATNIK